ncbi:hypothetical protein OPT61_g10193 [Boeremia exigua]|uniref:Uncharacterized protein n=1 Tax=Boeremia exigua TaxID=749465 RepID=A0ACC2HR42_9PLEO|nr:hypothetical protein OPT61_g10193 [Boeremia exigua]
MYSRKPEEKQSIVDIVQEFIDWEDLRDVLKTVIIISGPHTSRSDGEWHITVEFTLIGAEPYRDHITCHRVRDLGARGTIWAIGKKEF